MSLTLVWMLFYYQLFERKQHVYHTIKSFCTWYYIISEITIKSKYVAFYIKRNLDEFNLKNRSNNRGNKHFVTENNAGVVAGSERCERMSLVMRQLIVIRILTCLIDFLGSNFYENYILKLVLFFQTRRTSCLLHSS